MDDWEQIAQEDALWPWLADDSMADATYSDFNEETPDWDYCQGCGNDWPVDEIDADGFCPDCTIGGDE